MELILRRFEKSRAYFPTLDMLFAVKVCLAAGGTERGIGEQGITQLDAMVIRSCYICISRVLLESTCAPRNNDYS